MLSTSGSARKYIIIGITALAIILALVMIFLQFSTFRDLQAEVEEEETALEEARAHLARLQEHRDRAAEYEERLAFAEKMIPPEPEEDRLLRYIHRLAHEYDLRAREINFGSRAVEGNYTVMPFTLDIEGSFRDLGAFFNHLYNGDRAIRINDLDLSRGGGGGTTTVSISANAFYSQGD